ncbi:MAG: hypothetical protein N3E37_03400 [Candidatus Micrarchaeota archaeon]|nr:hypothetical protein [Candidatus Micrarchaeota archaeon]
MDNLDSIKVLHLFGNFDLKQVDEKFSKLGLYEKHENSIIFEVDSCVYNVSAESIQVKFPINKYYSVANTVILLLSTDSHFKNREFFSELLNIIGSEEFIRNGAYTILLNQLINENKKLEYDNKTLKEKFSVLENTITLQETQLSELKNKLMDYENLREDVLEQLIIDEIIKSKEFNVVEFSSKNKISVFQVNYVLKKLIDSEKLVSVNDVYYVKTHSKKVFQVNSYFNRIVNKIISLLRR